MPNFDWKKPLDLHLLAVAVVAGVLGFLKFHSPTLLDLDEYYHIAVSRLLLSGHFPHSLPFKFSLLGEFYADKDLLMHLLAVPFLLLVKDPVTAAKCTTVLMDTGLALVLFTIMARYAGKTAAAVLTMGLLASSYFVSYSLYMRPATLAILFTTAGLYFMAEKRKIPLLLTTMLFALAHVSAFTLVFFAFLCEGLRRVFYKEFNHDTIAYTLLGLMAGYIIHPNFPLNLATIYVNSILAPIYAHAPGLNTFGGELLAGRSNDVLSGALLVFALSGFIFWTAFALRPRVSFATVLFTAAAQIYFALGMCAVRFWHQAIPLTLLAAAAFWGDCRREETPENRWRLKLAAGAWTAVTALLILHTVPATFKSLEQRRQFIAPIAEAAQWAHGKLKPGTLIYHTLWSDSHALLLYAPEYTYISALDPVYMIYSNPQAAELSDKLMAGQIQNPLLAITDMFKANYVFTLKAPPFYKQVRAMPGFETIYENDTAAIFKLTVPAQTPQTKAKNHK